MELQVVIGQIIGLVLVGRELAGRLVSDHVSESGVLEEVSAEGIPGVLHGQVAY